MVIAALLHHLHPSPDPQHGRNEKLPPGNQSVTSPKVSGTSGFTKTSLSPFPFPQTPGKGITHQNDRMRAAMGNRTSSTVHESRLILRS